jgi:hypothetical protein
MSAMVMHECTCCKLVDGDTSLKPCDFCGRCNAWICRACRFDFIKRARAMFIRSQERHNANSGIS